MSTVIIYLHGFLSSPASLKASQTKAFAQRHYPHIDVDVPTLPNSPDHTVAALERIIDRHSGKRMGFIGSSMGGYLSTYLAEQHASKAVLINPAVRPYNLFRHYLGEHVNPYTEERFELSQHHLPLIRALEPAALKQAHKYWVLLQQGDETLDYREAERFYAGARQTIEPEGDHSFVGYERYLPEIFTFLLS